MTPSIIQGPDREKYFGILRSSGLSAALTTLHRDLEQLEFAAFEGPEGWKPDEYERLNQFRVLSRELWDTAFTSLKR